MTQIEVIQAVFHAQNKAKLESLTQEQKDAFILEKQNQASNEIIRFVSDLDCKYGHKWERIKAELSLGVEMPDIENMTADDFMAFIKPLVENAFLCIDKLKEHHEKEQAKYRNMLHEVQPQPIRVKPFSRS